MFLLWAALGFLSGSVMYSKILYEKTTGKRISEIADGNPGSSNVIRGAGIILGLIAMALDYSKGYLPVLLARTVGDISGLGLVPVAISPVLGHAFSPFLGMKGGKAVAVSFGIWSGLTLWVGPTIIGVLMLFFYVYSGTQYRWLEGHSKHVWPSCTSTCSKRFGSYPDMDTQYFSTCLQAQRSVGLSNKAEVFWR